MTTPVTNPQEPFTPFLPTTYNVPEDEDRLRAFLVDNLSNISDVLNNKKIGLYIQTTEVLNGNRFAYDISSKIRNGYQAIARIPSFPTFPLNNTLTLTLNSIPTYPITNVNPQFVVSQVWGSASKPCSAVGAGDGDYFSFFGEGNGKVTFTMSDTTIVITTTTDLSAYSGFIFVEYIRDGV